jgi:anthranilate phosphoribosyltransferase
MLFPLTDGQQAMRYAIGRIATGPHLSKDLTRAEARAAMAAVLRGEIDSIQTAVFLIALRMKRETDDEFLGLLDALAEVTPPVTAAVEHLAILADPFDGFNRSLPASPFLPPLHAACGLPTLAIGLALIGPKFGITHHLTLKAAGCPTDLTAEEAAAQIGRCGWAYCDQSRYAPALYALLQLRNTMIKRTPLTTLETVAMPVKGAAYTHQLAGYVHPPYARLYALLAQAAGFSSALITKGVEGGFIPSLRQPSKWIRFIGDGPVAEGELDPAALGIDQSVRAPLLPNEEGDVAETEVEKVGFDAVSMARAAARAGLAALHGEPGATADALITGAALALWHTGKAATLQEGAQRAREALRNGDALRRWQAAFC